jgi:hypothetical protein
MATSPDWARSAAANAQRKTGEAEAAATDELVEVGQTFHVGDAALGA